MASKANSSKSSKYSKAEPKSPYSDEERGEIASIYEMMRDQYGFYPDGLDSNDRIMWGMALKSDLQILFDKKSDYYFKRGEEIRAAGEGFESFVESKKINGYDENIPRVQR